MSSVYLNGSLRKAGRSIPFVSCFAPSAEDGALSQQALNEASVTPPALLETLPEGAARRGQLGAMRCEEILAGKEKPVSAVRSGQRYTCSGGLLAAFLAPGGKAASAGASSRDDYVKDGEGRVSGDLGAPESVRETVRPVLLFRLVCIGFSLPCSHRISPVMSAPLNTCHLRAPPSPHRLLNPSLASEYLLLFYCLV